MGPTPGPPGSAITPTRLSASYGPLSTMAKVAVLPEMHCWMCRWCRGFRPADASGWPHQCNHSVQQRNRVLAHRHLVHLQLQVHHGVTNAGATATWTAPEIWNAVGRTSHCACGAWHRRAGNHAGGRVTVTFVVIQNSEDDAVAADRCTGANSPTSSSSPGRGAAAAPWACRCRVGLGGKRPSLVEQLVTVNPLRQTAFAAFLSALLILA